VSIISRELLVSKQSNFGGLLYTLPFPCRIADLGLLELGDACICSTTGWTARWNGLKLMFGGRLPPQMPAWAVRQFFAAREIQNTCYPSQRHPGGVVPVKAGLLLGVLCVSTNSVGANHWPTISAHRIGVCHALAGQLECGHLCDLLAQGTWSTGEDLLEIHARNCHWKSERFGMFVKMTCVYSEGWQSSNDLQL